MLSNDLRAAVAAWMEQDPDPATHLATENLLAKADEGDENAIAELTDAFTGRLAFGTAGLRGALGPGPNRMNRVVVSQAAAGLAGYLQAHGLAGGRVIVGHDARYNSDVFAQDTAEILAGAGFHTLLANEPLPTPVIAFGILHYGCVAGVVVTASHNPPQDNGYKVYLGDGSQIVPPADADIADEIAAVAIMPLDELRRRDSYQLLGDDLVEGYLDRLAELVPADSPRELTWVHTSMHGVGGAIVRRAAHRLGFPAPSEVGAQAEPDPAFPTLAFPNPEEPGAMDLTLALAMAKDADVAIANDPDADRCAVAIPDEGGWRTLTGDELGVLLAEAALQRDTRGVYAASVVSSTQLASMAARHGQPFVTTLTGFKWIGRVPGLVYGYEEAIGYCTDPQAVPDKDGISTLVRVLALAADLRAQGHTIGDLLADITRQYGLFVTSQLAFRVDDLELISDAMRRLRANPPATIAGDPVAMTDLAAPTGDLPATDGLLFEGSRVRVVVRPSGTEPKLKCYLQVSLTAAESQDLEPAREAAGTLMARAREDVQRSLAW